jgi:hypothetical protein
MAIGIEDVVERTISALETSTSGDFTNIRGKLYEHAKQIELDLCHGTSGGTSGAALPLPHTLASFVWYLPLVQQTPITQSYTYPVLRPISSGCLIELFVEVGIAAMGGDVLFELYKNNVKFSEATLASGTTTVLVPVTGTLAEREFTRDDFFAFKITEAVVSRARFLTVYLRFFQYPYIMADAQDPLPEPA